MLDELLAKQHGACSMLDEHTDSLYCMQGGPAVAHRAFLQSLTAREGAASLPPALVESMFERRSASSLRLSANLGALVMAAPKVRGMAMDAARAGLLQSGQVEHRLEERIRNVEAALAR